jgi:glutamate dehydrogenase
VRQALELPQEAASGEEVVRAILKARVDLLYNGGIGTYVKAAAEEHAEVGDRANDRVRVNATELRARAVAEGGNLGFTQRARLEYWAHGGLVNTDAVDNSGGVDMSDHEVNIKILLDQLVRTGVIGSLAERNTLLASMTDAVSDLVLADNANQALALTLDGIRSARAYESFVDLTEHLVSAGILTRSDDAVPMRGELLTNPARDRGLPRPLLCVMLGHVKNWAFARGLASSLPDAEVAQPFLQAYFPAQMQDAYREHFGLHPLRREIIATAAVNYVVNHAGVGFLPHVTQWTEREVGDVIEAYLVADRESGAPGVRTDLASAGLAVGDHHDRLVDLEAALERATIKLLAREHVDWPSVLNGIRQAK